MTTDPTMRIVWHGGRAYAVSNHPGEFNPIAGGAYWYILVEGHWERLFECASADTGGDAWRDVERRIIHWLTVRKPSGPSDTAG